MSKFLIEALESKVGEVAIDALMELERVLHSTSK